MNYASGEAGLFPSTSPSFFFSKPTTPSNPFGSSRPCLSTHLAIQNGNGTRLSFAVGFYLLFFSISSFKPFWHLLGGIPSGLYGISCSCSVLQINWSLYVVFVTAFHLSEFVITAVYRKAELCFDCTCDAPIQSLAYLVNQSPEYEVAMITGILEFWIEFFLVPKYESSLRSSVDFASHSPRFSLASHCVCVVVCCEPLGKSSWEATSVIAFASSTASRTSFLPAGCIRRCRSLMITS